MSSIKVLIVDDDENNLDLIEYSIADESDRAIERANSGQEAIQKAAQYEYAVILLDICMPVMDGFETAQLLRKSEKNSRTPIIFVTALRNEQCDFYKGYENQVIDILTKPIEPSVLKLKVNFFIEIAKQRKQLSSMTEELKGNEKLKREIEEHKETVLALKKNEEKFRMLFEHSNDLITIRDKNISIISANSAWKKTLGEVPKTAEETKKRIHPADRKRVLAAFNSIRYDGEAFNNIPLRYQHSNGEYKFLETSARLVMVSDQPLLYVVSRDISARERTEQEKKEMQEQLCQSAKLATIGTLSAGITHELNTPLTSIIVSVDNIRQRITDKDLVESRLKQIDKATDHMKYIINHLLIFTRKTTLKDWCQISLKDKLNAAISFLDARLRAKDININIDAEENLPTILGNAIELESVFLNLIVNSIDAFDAVDDERIKNIKIDIAASDFDIKMTFEDNASGMSEEVKNKIFDLFFTTKKTGKGTGLGMPITHHIIKKHGGDITVKTKSKEGTRFEMFFPIDNHLKA